MRQWYSHLGLLHLGPEPCVRLDVSVWNGVKCACTWEETYYTLLGVRFPNRFASVSVLR